MRNNRNVTVVDYGAGNILSVCRGLTRVGATVSLSSDPKEILKADKLILPGVGAFRSAMSKLESLGLVDSLKELAVRDIPLLGICLGMEILFDGSEEFGASEGLGLIPGQIVPVPSYGLSGEKLKMPHIGWNALIPENHIAKSMRDTIEVGISQSSGKEFYFVHSFMARPTNPENTLLLTLYGGNKIPAFVRNRNIFGVQFHPEKSGIAGLDLLELFSKI